MKKIIAALMAVVLLLSCGVTAFGAQEDYTLKFDENGKFKLLLLADIQDGFPIRDDLVAYINQALDKTQPDLVVFLGDNIMRPEDATHESYWSSYDYVLTPIVERGIPFTLVFGNHDQESMPDIPIEEMLAKYMSYDGCLAFDADPSLHGCGTHNLEILSSNGTKTAFNLWLMDSGDYVLDADGSRLGYDCVRKDQIDWYKAQSAKLAQANGGLVPSLMFQHIVPQEVFEKIMIKSPFNLGEATKNFSDGTSYTFLPKFGSFKGHLFEPPCPSLDNDGQWDALVETGDVMGVFFGHDHTNTYRTDINGVEAINVPGATYESYYSYIDQGSMLVTLDENDPGNYQCEIIYSNDLALEKGSELPGLTRSKAEYVFSKICRVLLAAVERIFEYVLVRIK